MIEQFPELADQGFWYVVPAVASTEPTPFRAARTVDVPGDGWCAWYGDDGQAVVRTPAPLAAIEANTVPAAQVLADDGYDAKPYGRIRGG